MEKIGRKSWPDGIPPKLDFPNKPLYEFLRDNAVRNPQKVAIDWGSGHVNQLISRWLIPKIRSKMPLCWPFGGQKECLKK